MKRFLVALLSLALVATSCGDDSSGSGPETTTTTSPATPTTADPGDGEVEDPPATEAPTEEIELFASAQGVTETEILFGIAAIDAAALLPFGFDLGQAPIEDMYVAWTDAQNNRGGVLGRNLVPHTRLFLPIGTAGADAVCAEFAEDIGADAYCRDAAVASETASSLVAARRAA